MRIKKILVFLLILTSIGVSVRAQTWFTKNGQVSFFSKTVLEDISATNNQVISVINIQTGVIRFSLLNNSFHFEKAKMEQDFNEDYIESDRYPRSTFSGTIQDVGGLDFTQEGVFPVKVAGKLEIHGVAKDIEIPGFLIIKAGNISVKASFPIEVRDYKIKIPTIVTDKIAEKIEVSVSCHYQKK